MTARKLARSNQLFWHIFPSLLLREDDLGKLIQMAQISYREYGECIKTVFSNQTNIVQLPIFNPKTGEFIYAQIDARIGDALADLYKMDSGSRSMDILSWAISKLGTRSELDGRHNEIARVLLEVGNVREVIFDILRYKGNLPDGSCIETANPLRNIPQEATISRVVHISLN